MRNLKALGVVLFLFSCGIAEDVPVVPSQGQQEATGPVWPKATWIDRLTCAGGVLGGDWATLSGAGPPAKLGTIPAACCPPPKTYAATCSCPLHGERAVCDVVVAADCSATLVGHSEYNMSVTLRP
jgi:hypothetical protein